MVVPIAAGVSGGVLLLGGAAAYFVFRKRRLAKHQGQKMIDGQLPVNTRMTDLIGETTFSVLQSLSTTAYGRDRTIVPSLQTFTFTAATRAVESP